MRYLATLLVTLIMPFGLAHAASATTTEQLKIELVSESTTLAPGAAVWLGLRMQHAPGWHTYWINPGDSGLPTKLKWALPAGYHADDIDWPIPKRFDVGGIANFGYDGAVLLPVILHIPADATSGARANLAVDVRWLVCHEECIPGRAMLALDLPVATQTKIDPRWRNAFANARDGQRQEKVLQASARDTGQSIEIDLPRSAFGDTAQLDAFAVQTKIVSNTRPAVDIHASNIMLRFAKSDYFTSLPDALDLIVMPANAHALRAHATFIAPGAAPSRSSQ